MILALRRVPFNNDENKGYYINIDGIIDKSTGKIVNGDKDFINFVLFDDYYNMYGK